jgi:cytochrome d ubiquinol oxidase subunit II
MILVAYVVLGLMFAVYVALDGYDLGVAIVSPAVARSDADRADAMASIGPFWNGNEVWLIAAGGTLFAFFPQAYASSFSGFYLPLIIVLWLLMFRGIALELRDHFPSAVWHGFWDAAFTGSSALLAILYGVALGNLLRGVPLDAHGYFAGTFAFLLNPYAVAVGLFALLVLAQHGLTFLAYRADATVAQRAAALVPKIWWPTAAAYLGITAATLAVRGANAGVLSILPVVSLAALVTLLRFATARRAQAAFAASSVFVLSLLAAAAGTLYPYIVPAYPARSGGLSIYDATPSPAVLGPFLAVVIAGLAAVIVYRAIAVRRISERSEPSVLEAPFRQVE